MGIAHRLAEVFGTKVNTALDHVEDPADLLDYSYSLQVDLLQKIRNSLVEVVAARRRVEAQEAELRTSAEQVRAQAEQALTAGHDDVAHQALTWRAAIFAQADELAERQDALRADEEKLAATLRRLEVRVEAFRNRKEAVKAGYTVAEAETYINRLLDGLSAEVDDIGGVAGIRGATVARWVEDKTAQAQAKADALDELITAANLQDLPAKAVPDDLQARLDAISRKTMVDAELARMKERLH